MQVKKFEAKTMKEALEMIKKQMGPDAIILSARDNRKNFGLIGGPSFEVTAAVPESTIQKKKFIESKMREEDRNRFEKSPARTQIKYMDKAVQRALEDQAEARIIKASEKVTEPPTPRTTITSVPYIEIDRPEKSLSNQDPREENNEIAALKNEILSLKNIISQTLSSSPHLMRPKTEALPVSEQGIHQQPPPQNQYPGGDYGIPYNLSPLFEKLTLSGLLPDLVGEIFQEAQRILPSLKFKNRSLVASWVAKYLMEKTRVCNPEKLGKIQIFFGPPGGGKTTALVKMASQLILEKKKKIALLTCDTLKVGSIDQLKLYSQILNVPFSTIKNETDWKIILEKLPEIDHFFCDCPGLTLRRFEESHSLKGFIFPENSLLLREEKIWDEAPLTNRHLVLSASTKDLDQMEWGKRYKILSPTDVIFTGVDQTLQHGALYNFMILQNLPLFALGTGPQIPDDWKWATPEVILDLIFKLSSKQGSSDQNSSENQLNSTYKGHNNYETNF